MQIGIVGLGKMGYNLALNLRDHGHDVVAYDIFEDAVIKIEREGIVGVRSIEDLIKTITGRKIIWVMVPSGNTVDAVITKLAALINKKDIIIDGGNSHYKDTLKRFEFLESKGIDFADVGTSGGMTGARNGACTMTGAKPEVYAFLEPVLKSISVEGGSIHTGENGSGHYVKMIHNGIEYGMMQAIGEGFEVLKSGPFDIDFESVAGVWNHGSVIRSWLMELTESVFSKDPNLDKLKGVVDSSGEGLWTLEEALALQIPTPVIALSLLTRFSSKIDDSFSNRLVAGLRNEFGGHQITKK